MSQKTTAKSANRQKSSKPNKETFSYMGERYVFDITKAIKFAGDGREAFELAQDDVRFSLKKVRINKDHVKTVDVTKPGIVANLQYECKDGSLVRGHRLIDGHHRAQRCLKLGVPFQVYLLTDTESDAIVLKQPKQQTAPARSE
ncbi:MAG: hypothetical protein JSS27_15780 [Planctomycetes bacterium]|nr:hypothetical protein [Planctomycetota bacterium]